ncbi:MAG: HNH endonuclease [Anaerolineae bacterium]|nr:HNH endonuclease [Anaerolineae bacterium]
MDTSWRPIIIELEMDYEVSASGQVRRRTTHQPLPGTINTCGYPVVTLTIQRGERKFPIHRLVARAFLGPCPEGLEVHPLDGVRTHSQNLRYVTRAENLRAGVETGTVSLFEPGEGNPSSKLSEAQVRNILALLRYSVRPGAIRQIQPGAA